LSIVTKNINTQYPTSLALRGMGETRELISVWLESEVLDAGLIVALDHALHLTGHCFS
jgi:hypothetical protein